jgi:hypothetical protein
LQPSAPNSRSMVSEQDENTSSSKLNMEMRFFRDTTI